MRYKPQNSQLCVGQTQKSSEKFLKSAWDSLYSIALWEEAQDLMWPKRLGENNPHLYIPPLNMCATLTTSVQLSENIWNKHRGPHRESITAWHSPSLVAKGSYWSPAATARSWINGRAHLQWRRR